jgi:hypothetical protein
LEYYDIYYKMQYVFKLHLQIFTGAQCGILLSRGTCPTCTRFLPTTYDSCPLLWPQPLLLSVPVVRPNLGEKWRKNTLSLTYPRTEKSRGVKSGDRGGQAILKPRLVQTTTHTHTHTHNTMGAPHRYTTPWWLTGFLSSSARMECHLVVWRKTWAQGATFETYLTKLLLPV